MVVVDTSVWIDFLAGRGTQQATRLDELLAAENAAVGDLIVCEVLQGIREPRVYRRAHATLTGIDVIPMVSLRRAVRAADNYRALRRLGITVRGTIDCIIATAVIEGGHMILHSDRDFDPFEEHRACRCCATEWTRRAHYPPQ